MQVCLCVSVSLFLPGCFANRFSFCRFFCCWNYLIGFSKIESRSGHILRRKQGGRMHDVQGIAKLVFDTVYQKTSVTAMTRAAYHNVIAYTHIHKLRIERNKKKQLQQQQQQHTQQIFEFVVYLYFIRCSVHRQFKGKNVDARNAKRTTLYLRKRYIHLINGHSFQTTEMAIRYIEAHMYIDTHTRIRSMWLANWMSCVLLDLLAFFTLLAM